LPRSIKALEQPARRVFLENHSLDRPCCRVP